MKNSLGLSDDMIFQHNELAQRQIDGNFSFADKKEYILRRLNQEDITNDYWGDLGLGCSQLFVSDIMPETKGSDPMQHIFLGKHHRGINNTAVFLSNEQNDKLLFSLNYHQSHLPDCLFPNAKIIAFKNNLKMVNHRCSLIPNDKASRVWYRRPSDYAWDEGIIEGEREPDFIWNTEWFRDETKTMNGIKELYRLLDLTGWERAESFIKEYYQIWYEKNHLSINTKGIQL